MTKTEIEDIILVEVLDFKKPERAGYHCRALAAKAATRILAAQAEHRPQEGEDAIRDRG